MCTSFQAKYKVLDKIGEGSFSEVLKCQDRQTGMLYAAKHLKKTYENVNEIFESPEMIAMRKITRHPNVLHMVESHYDVLPGRVTLIFELMDMSLYDLIRNRKGRLLVENRVKYCVYQMLKGLDHLHKHGIFHRDIKPENILLKGNVVKIGDLGSIRGVYSKPPYTEYISTRWYRSPECLLTGGFYGPKMDIWAAGCVFYELLTLEPLFPGENEVDQISKIHSILGTPHARLVAKFRRISRRTRNSDFYFPAREGRGLGCLLPRLSNRGLDALGLMLIYDPENRASARDLLEHRYFGDVRQRESARLTRSSVLSSNPTHDLDQCRNPMIVGYLSSERHRRLRSQVRCGDGSKAARTVESTPNARTMFQGVAGESRVPEPARLDDLGYTQIGRYFLKKRLSMQNNRLNAQSRKWHDAGTKYSCDRNTQQRENIGAKSASIARPEVFCQSFFLHKEFETAVHREENFPSNSNQLPAIFLNSKRNSVYVADSSKHAKDDGACKMSLVGIREYSAQGLPTRKGPSSRSPLKKIAKREIGNTCQVHTTLVDTSKLCPRKSYEQRKVNL